MSNQNQQSSKSRIDLTRFNVNLAKIYSKAKEEGLLENRLDPVQLLHVKDTLIINIHYDLTDDAIKFEIMVNQRLPNYKELGPLFSQVLDVGISLGMVLNSHNCEAI